ncbi:MAG: ACT domain-containing protein [Acidimicrobiia bacterium]
MAMDLTVELQNRPGTLADLGEALGKAQINIDGVAGVATDGTGLFHILVEDAAAARQALGNAGLKVTDEREVVVVDVEDRPGMLGEVARKIADTGANIDLVYLAAGTRLVIGGDNLQTIRTAV